MTAGEILGWTFGSAGVVGSVGTGIAFVWNKIEKRFAAIERELKQCEVRERVTQKRSAVHITVIELLLVGMKRQRPSKAQNQTLDRARELLDGLKKELPEEDLGLSELARSIDRRSA